MNGYPLIIGHDGCEGSPPGTEASVQKAFEAGADIAEVDVRPTRDGVVILRHDKDIALTSGEHILISETSYEDIRDLEARGDLDFSQSGESITRLDEVFEYVRGTNRLLNVDVKGKYSIDSALRTIEGAGIRDNVMISGCDLDMAKYVRERCPEIDVVLNVDEESGSTVPLTGEIVEELYVSLVSAGCRGINMDYRHCTADTLRFFQNRHIPVCVWTVDDDDAIKRFIGLGVHTITTNRVSRAAGLRRHCREYCREIVAT